MTDSNDLTRAFSNLAIAPTQVQSYSNDLGRVLRSEVNHDGSVSSTTQGPLKSSVADTHRDQSGTFTSMRNHLNPITADRLTPDSVVGIEGYGEMKLSSAIAAGLAVKLADGTYAPGAPEAAVEQEVSHPDLDIEALSDTAVEGALTSLVEATTPSLQIHALNQLTTAGEIDQRTLGNIASDLGCEPHEVSAKVEPIIQAFTQQASEVVAQHGVNPQSVFDWAWSSRQADMQKATRDHGMLRSTRAYNDIAKDYVMNLDTIDPEALLNADLGPGITIRRERGKIMVHTARDGSYDWKAAVRSGLIKLGRR